MAEPLLRPWFGPVGALTWNLTLGLSERLLLREPWVRQMRAGLRREFRDLNPIAMVRRLRGKEPAELAYGETPPLSYLQVLRSLELAPGARVVDLGSGRGIPCFTAVNQGYRVTGLEFFVPYVERARRIAEAYGWPVEFRSGSFLDGDLPAAELYTVSATAYPEKLRAQLKERLLQAPPGAWIVSQDWILGEPFVHERMQALPVSWGIAHHCFQRRP